MSYLYRIGKGSTRRVMHLARYGALGDISGPLCGKKLDLDTAINVPHDTPICKDCYRIWKKANNL